MQTLLMLKIMQENLQDALFFRDVEYIVTIPKDFTQEFFTRKTRRASKDYSAKLYY